MSIKKKRVDEAPCHIEAETWRDCLKEGDYMPDKDRSKCEGSRRIYYNCLNKWRSGDSGNSGNEGERKVSFFTSSSSSEKSSSSSSSSAPPPGSTPSACSGMADRLRSCMEMSMFETAKCQREMNALRDCMATQDEQVAAIARDLRETERRELLRREAKLGGVKLSQLEAAKLAAEAEQQQQLSESSNMASQMWGKLWGTPPKHGK